MTILHDIVTSTYNFPNIGRTLSKRPAGMVAGSFILLVLLYVVIYGMWYASIGSDFIDAALDVSKPYLPSFNITGGRLTMQSAEPYILTQDEMYSIMIGAIREVDKKRFGGKYSAGLEKGVEAQRASTGREQTFCLVMDTTGTYGDKVNLANYSKYAVITTDSMELVDRVKSMPGNKVPIAERVKQDIRFTPDLINNLAGPMNRISAISIIIALFIATPIRFLIKALISALVVWLILAIAKKEISFSAMYKISLYALSPVVVLAVISRFTVPIPGLIYIVLYFACITIAAMAAIKAKQVVVQK